MNFKSIGRKPDPCLYSRSLENYIHACYSDCVNILSHTFCDSYSYQQQLLKSNRYGKVHHKIRTYCYVCQSGKKK